MSGYYNQQPDPRHAQGAGQHPQASSSRYQSSPPENNDYDDGEAVYTSYYDEPEPAPESQTSLYDADYDSPEGSSRWERDPSSPIVTFTS